MVQRKEEKMNTEKIGIVLSFAKGGEEKNGNIYYNGEQLTIGTIRNLGLREYRSENNTTKMYIQVVFITNEKITEVDVPFVELESGKFLKYRPPDFHVLTTIDKKTEKFFCKSILRSISGLSVEKYYCLSLGYNHIEGKVVYNTGDRVINAPELKKWISESDFRIKYGEPKSIEAYKKWISEFLKSLNYPPVLLIAALVPYIFPLIDENKRVHYEFVGYIVGKSGCGKTEIAKLLVTPFNDNCNMLSLSSDNDAINEMSAFNDCSVLFDDLNASDSYDIKKQKERKVASIVETKQSVGKSVKDGKNTKINAFPFITAEYPLKREGFTNRCLIVNIDEPFDPKSLTWLQENHDIYISFINSFIAVICENFQILHDHVNNCLSSVKYHTKKGKGISGLTRVVNIKLILEITLDILKWFLGVSDDNLSCFPSYVDTFKQSIDECIGYTIDLLKEQSKDKEEVIITQLLYDIWDSESEIVTTDEDSFLCSINNNPDSLPKHFVIYQKGKHRFCLRSKDAQRYLGGKIGYRTITDKLDQFGLLDVKKDRTTAVFKGKSNAKFLCIRQKALADYLGMENEFLPPDIQTDRRYNHQSTMDVPQNYSNYTGSELNNSDVSEIEAKMTGQQDDHASNYQRIINHARKKGEKLMRKKGKNL